MRWDMILKKAREEEYREGFEIGLKMAKEEHLRFVIMNLVNMEKPVDFIAKAVGETPQYVEQVIAKAQALQVGSK